jgi:hypothetical protein
VRPARAAAALALVLLAGTVGCVQTFDSTTLGVPVTLAGAPGPQPEGTPFRTNVHTLHAFFGLLALSQPNLQKALARQLVGGEQIAQLRIRARSRWTDVLVTVLTAGLLAPRTITFDGVIVGR